MDRFLAAVAAGYGALGVGALARPTLVPDTFGATASTPQARTEIRAVYGGLPLAIAGLLVAAPRSSAVPVGVMTAGMAAGRVVGGALEPGPTPAVTRLFVGIELVLSAACFAGAGRGRKG